MLDGIDLFPLRKACYIVVGNEKYKKGGLRGLWDGRSNLHVRIGVWILAFNTERRITINTLLKQGVNASCPSSLIEHPTSFR